MGEITVEEFDTPKNRRPADGGVVVDLQGWLRAPVDWDGTQLEKLWNASHPRSRLGVGLCVANSPRRHFILSNTRDDPEAARAELEGLIAKLQQAPATLPVDDEQVRLEDPEGDAASA